MNRMMKFLHWLYAKCNVPHHCSKNGHCLLPDGHSMYHLCDKCFQRYE